MIQCSCGVWYLYPSANQCSPIVVPNTGSTREEFEALARQVAELERAWEERKP